MFRRIQDFLDDWACETEATLKIIGALTPESLAVRATPGGRSLADLAWHLVVTIPEMMNRTGLSLDGPAEDSTLPTMPQGFAETYKSTARQLAEAVGREWTDASLEQAVEMYGESWPRGKALAALISHQAHHRGQMTVLMRMAGLLVPGVYGPAREEWSTLGIPAPW